jgi:integral membrane protein
MTNLLSTQLGRLRFIAFIEGVSFLVILFITMPLKYFFGSPMPNKIFGMLHGILFILYILAVVTISYTKQWRFSKMLLALLASIIPFGTFWADSKLFREKPIKK